MSSVPYPNDGSGPKRRKTPWQIAWDSGLAFGLALLLGSGLFASALLPWAPEWMTVLTRPGRWGASGAAVATLILASALTVLWYVWPPTLRRWRLVRHGVRVAGQVIRTEPWIPAKVSPNAPKGLIRFRSEHRVRVHYRFSDAAGVEHDGYGQPRELWPRPAPGDPIPVLYDPRRPGNSAPEDDLAV
ncbi:DUF3592 domain-containing protein [Inquilinus sp. Marseille-Q2685]|uniref:DUF3592 domain-containing protein n=1 Tax=Inquilinus sp. Marseille-Q2685 TaxID=2866581 RepID=UPI001CE40D73|nr:DUF3592 domain-containing protein [Inquilinus sp. Marseille-Q2685]